MLEEPSSPRPKSRVIKPSNSAKILRTVYDGSSHVSIITQTHGSVWPKVLPFCIFNTCLTAFIMYLRNNEIVDLTMTSDCLSFVSLLVSFFVVSRSSVIVRRYMEARTHLEQLFLNATEIVHHASIFTMHDLSDGAKKWRRLIAYKVILLLRVSMSALEHSSHADQAAWDVAELSPENRQILREAVKTSQEGTERSKENILGRRTRESLKTHVSESFQATSIVALDLRTSIVGSCSGGYIDTRLRINEERQLLWGVDGFVSGFTELRKLVVADFPLPLLQMARTILFFWIFALPFTLAGEQTNYVQPCVVIFVMTFGFLGLEYVSMELDDPFGDDPNDFDDFRMTQLTCEDIFITIFKIDGMESAKKLKEELSGNDTSNGVSNNLYSLMG